MLNINLKKSLDLGHDRYKIHSIWTCYRFINLDIHICLNLILVDTKKMKTLVTIALMVIVSKTSLISA